MIFWLREANWGVYYDVLYLQLVNCVCLCVSPLGAFYIRCQPLCLIAKQLVCRRIYIQFTQCMTAVTPFTLQM
jgi:hypothetical protein